MQRDAEPLAQRGAVRLVGAGRRAQPVVAVQRLDGRRREPHGDVEQADGVAPAGEQHEHRPPGAQQAARADALEQVAMRARR